MQYYGIIMFGQIALLCLFFIKTWAIPGYTTTGIHFVVAFPGIRKNTGVIIMDTDEEFVTVYLTIPNSLLSGQNNRVEIRRLGGDKLTRYVINERLRLPDKSGMYRSIVIRSTGPIRALLWMSSESETESMMDAFKLLPKESCDRMYYISAPKSNDVFLLVHAFDEPLTVNITFASMPTGTSGFEEECAGNDNAFCAPGKTIELTLNKFEVWSFRFEKDLLEIDLTGTTIASDKSIYVVCGGTLRIFPDPKKGPDTYTGEVRPSVSWGKEYVFPSFLDVGTTYFTFKAEQLPLDILIYENTSKPVKLRWSENSSIYPTGKHTEMVAFKAVVPFGVYIFFPSRVGESVPVPHHTLFNLVPVEQWLHGTIVRHDVTLSLSPGIYGKYYVITRQAGTLNSDVVDNFSKFTWRNDHTITVDNISYVYGFGYLEKNNVTNINVKSPAGTVMVYVVAFRGNPFESMFVFAYDYYLGKIYQNDCLLRLTGDVITSDGIDNDCDGFIDEEVKNGRDDDGDGSVDEDLVDEFQHGKWGYWTEGHSVACHRIPMHIRTRACRGRSRLGNHCEGLAIDCNHDVCPQSCITGINVSDLCFFVDYCQDCNSEGFFYCDQCVNGYAPTRHCTTPCPSGWGGPGCTSRCDSMSYNCPHETGALLEEKSSSDFNILYVIGLLMAGVICGLVVVMIYASNFEHQCLFDVKDETINDMKPGVVPKRISFAELKQY